MNNTQGMGYASQESVNLLIKQANNHKKVINILIDQIVILKKKMPIVDPELDKKIAELEKLKV